LKQKILSCIYVAIDEANLERDGKPPLEKAPGTPIHGTESALDSLDLVNLIIAIEENLEATFGKPIVLSDDRVLDAEPSPFEKVASLAEYVEGLLAENEPARESQAG
jgi:acyl carrier protein